MEESTWFNQNSRRSDSRRLAASVNLYQDGDGDEKDDIDEWTPGSRNRISLSKISHRGRGRLGAAPRGRPPLKRQIIVVDDDDDEFACNRYAQPPKRVRQCELTEGVASGYPYTATAASYARVKAASPPSLVNQVIVSSSIWGY